MPEAGPTTPGERAEFADELHAEAEELLAGGLLELLEAHLGPVRVAGSVALDLMAVPDIDLYAQVEASDADRFAPVLTELPAHLRRHECALASLTFRDEHVVPDPRFPTTPGLYLAATFVAPSGRTWTMDLWGWAAEDHARRAGEDRELAASLAAVDRDRVLRCKHLPGYGRDFRSVDVYDFVRGAPPSAEDPKADREALLARRRQ